MGEFYRTHAVSLGYGFSQALGVARRGGILSRKKSPVRREDRPRYLSSLAEEVNECGLRGKSQGSPPVPLLFPIDCWKFHPRTVQNGSFGVSTEKNRTCALLTNENYEWNQTNEPRKREKTKQNTRVPSSTWTFEMSNGGGGSWE
jgi:hypothetical protein